MPPGCLGLGIAVGLVMAARAVGTGDGGGDQVAGGVDRSGRDMYDALRLEKNSARVEMMVFAANEYFRNTIKTMRLPKAGRGCDCSRSAGYLGRGRGRC